MVPRKLVQDAGAVCEAERLASPAAVGQVNPSLQRPFIEISGAGRVIRKKTLELSEIFREGKIRTVNDVHGSLPYPAKVHYTLSICGSQPDNDAF